MKILVLNSGSSSLKFQVIDTSAEQIAANKDQLLAKGEVEKIGSSESLLSFTTPGEPEIRTVSRLIARGASDPLSLAA